MLKGTPGNKKIDLEITNGYHPLRFPAVNNEICYNFFDFDGSLFPTAGFEKLQSINENGRSRGIFYSNLLKSVIAVIDNDVFKITPLHVSTLFSLDTLSGDVFFAENSLTTSPNAATGDPGGQLVLSDGVNIYVYTLDQTVTKATGSTETGLGFLPGMIAYLNARMVCNVLNSNQIRGSELNDARTFPGDQLGITDTETRGIISFKTMLFVFGKDKTTIFHDTNGFPFPFTPDTTRAFQYGASSAASIAVGMNLFCWVGVTKFSTPVVLASSGGNPMVISNDAIDSVLDDLTKVQNNKGFIYQLDGHIFYQINFLSDNISLLYDFNTKKWYRVSDKNLNGHPVQGAVIYEEENRLLAITSTDGNIHDFNLKIYTNDGAIIPRIVGTKNYSLDERPIICSEIDIQMEQGTVQDFSRVCLLISKDRGRTYRQFQIKEIADIGDRDALMRFYKLGSSRWWTMRFDFYSPNRIVVLSAQAFFVITG